MTPPPLDPNPTPTVPYTTSGGKVGGAFARFLMHPGDHRLQWAAALAVVGVAGVAYGRIQVRSDSTERPPRWRHADHGGITGPRWARRQCRRTFRPLVEHVPSRRHPNPSNGSAYRLDGPDELGEWDALALRYAPVIARRARRWWKEAAGALEWPSRFVSFTVTPNDRTLVVAAKAVPDVVELSRKLHELGVLSDHGLVTIERARGAAGHVVVRFADAVVEDVVDVIGRDDGYFTTTTVDGVEQPRTWAPRPGYVEVIIGRQWTSLYDLDAYWFEPGARYLDGDEPITLVPRYAQSTPPPGPVVGPRTGTSPDNDNDNPDNGPLSTSNNAVRLSHQQIGLLAALADEPGQGRDVAERLGRNHPNVLRSLKRLADIGLAESLPAGAPDGTWHPTDAGRYLVGDTEGTLPPAAAWPPPPPPARNEGDAA